jgi:predicted deacylase
MMPEPGLDQPTAIESRMLEIPANGDAGTGIPVTIIRGARPGPALALIAGNHGYEYPHTGFAEAPRTDRSG